MIDSIIIKKNLVNEMIAHAREEIPNECCGILAGENCSVTKVYPAINTKHSPSRYCIDPLELLAILKEIEENRWKFLGIYHSHTNTEAFPSATDIKSAVFPESVYFIISLKNPNQAMMRGFYIIKGNIIEIELRILPN